MSIYNENYIKETSKKLQNFLGNSENYQKFSFDIEKGLREPPVIEICRYMEEGMPFHCQEQLTRYCILERTVTVMLNEKEVGKILLTDISARWDIFQVFVDYPMSLSNLIDVCVGHVTAKYMPPLKDTPKEQPIKGSKE